MFTKMVLPRLGGAPAVWSVAMVFFQAALLVGYAYAHVLVRRLAPRTGALVHLGVLAIAALTLPIGMARRSASADRVCRRLADGLLAMSVGVPFVALSASAPLLQSWFAASGHPQAGNPYVLYAASNLGSFAALIAYPILIEPMLSLHDQSRLWSVGFAGLAMLIAAASLYVATGRDCVGGRSGAARSTVATGSPGQHWPRSRPVSYRGDVYIRPMWRRRRCSGWCRSRSICSPSWRCSASGRGSP